jgi:ribosomal protein S18 acetylase RimI-like enzyme
MSVVIRQATKADFDQVGRVFSEENRYHSEIVPGVIQVAEPIMTQEWYSAVLDNPDRSLWVAQVDEAVIGVVLVKEMTSPDDPIFCQRKYAYVDEVVVAERFRGRGIGRLLMERAEQWAMERGLGEIELNVWEANQSAIGFYEGLSYETIRRRMRRIIG